MAYPGFDMLATVSSGSVLATNVLMSGLAHDIIELANVKSEIQKCGGKGWTRQTLLQAGNTDYNVGLNNIWQSQNSGLHIYEGTVLVNNQTLNTGLNSCGKQVINSASNSLITASQNKYDQQIYDAATKPQPSHNNLPYNIPPWLLKTLLMQEGQMYGKYKRTLLQGSNPPIYVFSIAQITEGTATTYRLQLNAAVGLPATTSVANLEKALDGDCDQHDAACPDQTNFFDDTEVNRAIIASAFLLNQNHDVELKQATFDQAAVFACSANPPSPYTPYCLTDAQVTTLMNGWALLPAQEQWKLTLAAYNSGPATVRIAILNAASHGATEFSWNTVRSSLVLGDSAKQQVTTYVDNISTGHPTKP